jgi:hypothetical protein
LSSRVSQLIFGEHFSGRACILFCKALHLIHARNVTMWQAIDLRLVSSESLNIQNA